jgi:6-phosphofructokinase 1
MNVGILTGGGDCPGLNAVLRAVGKALMSRTDAQLIGIEDGFLGLIERRVRPLDWRALSGILMRGGTILGTHNRANPFAYFGANGADVSGAALDYIRELGLDCLVAIGGDGTMRIAHGLQQLGVPVVGVPKTIDNDLPHTERTFGFDTAVSVVAEALDRLRTTAQSHGRVMILETMGRYAGWIALEGGIAGGAHVILLPELPYDIDAIVQYCRERSHRQRYTVIAVAEGAMPKGGAMTVRDIVASSPDPIRLGGVGDALRQQIESRLDVEVRTTVLGHVQRGGTPTAYDRILATRFGAHAAHLVATGQTDQMVVLRGDACASVPLADAAGSIRLVPLDHRLLDAARGLGVSLGQPQ